MPRIVLLSVLLGLCCLNADAQAVDRAPPVQTDWAEVNNVSLRYELSGTDTDTLVLLHEMGMTLESWDYVMPQLRKQHRVLRYDLRGFGLSEKIRGAVTFTDEVQDLHALLNALNINGRVTLVGGAIGGAIALAYAATYPEQVKGVIAMSPAAGAAPQQSATAKGGNPASVARSSMRTIVNADLEALYPASIQSDPKRVAHFRALQLSTDPDSMAASLSMIISTDFSQYYPKIKSPTLIIAPSLYASRPVASVKQIADAITGAQFAVLKTGHFIALESPELLLPIAEKFFATLQ